MGLTLHRRIFTTGLAEAKVTFSSQFRRFVFAPIPHPGNPCRSEAIRPAWRKSFLFDLQLFRFASAVLADPVNLRYQVHDHNDVKQQHDDSRRTGPPGELIDFERNK